MPVHAEKRTLPYAPEQLFALVADVDRYHEFLPWCVDSRIKRRKDNIFYADMVLGYKMFRETISSKVTLDRPELIHVEYLSGPMQYLTNHWRFIEEPDGSCTIDFYVEFEFRNRFLEGLIGAFFNEVVRRMVKAFEDRAQDLYGSPNGDPSPLKSG